MAHGYPAGMVMLGRLASGPSVYKDSVIIEKCYLPNNKAVWAITHGKEDACVR